MCTVPEAVAEYGFESDRELYRLIREGVIPSGPVVHLGRKVRIHREQLERWLAAGGSALPGGWRRDPDTAPQADGVIALRPSPAFS